MGSARLIALAWLTGAAAVLLAAWITHVPPLDAAAVANASQATLAGTVADSGPRLVLVTIDGVRWREVFRGADPNMLAAELRRGVNEAPVKFWRATPHEARAALMPFLWTTVATGGQLFGNPDVGSPLVAQNPHLKSFPGYAELLSGFPSQTITSNRARHNPDVTVLEWLNRRPAVAGSVAVFASWALFPFILNQPRSQLWVTMGQGAGWSALWEQARMSISHPWQESIYDAFVFRAAMRHLQQRSPRVLYLALGDADEWAHGDRYDHYLQSLHRSDGWLRELWALIEAHPAYRGRTTLLVTTDHGRGDSDASWTGHGWDIEGSQRAFVAALGRGVPARGERRDVPNLTLGQVAATAAAVMGEDYRAAVPQAAPPLPFDSR